MKEAAGEANLTILAVVLIAIIVAVATPLINNMMKTTKKKSCCTASGGEWKNNSCQTEDQANYSECAGEDA